MPPTHAPGSRFGTHLDTQTLWTNIERWQLEMPGRGHGQWFLCEINEWERRQCNEDFFLSVGESRSKDRKRGLGRSWWAKSRQAINYRIWLLKRAQWEKSAVICSAWPNSIHSSLDTHKTAATTPGGIDITHESMNEMHRHLNKVNLTLDGGMIETQNQHYKKLPKKSVGFSQCFVQILILIFFFFVLSAASKHLAIDLFNIFIQRNFVRRRYHLFACGVWPCLCEPVCSRELCVTSSRLHKIIKQNKKIQSQSITPQMFDYDLILSLTWLLSDLLRLKSRKRIKKPVTLFCLCFILVVGHFGAAPLSLADHRKMTNQIAS